MTCANSWMGFPESCPKSSPPTRMGSPFPYLSSSPYPTVGKKPECYMPTGIFKNNLVRLGSTPYQFNLITLEVRPKHWEGFRAPRRFSSAAKTGCIPWTCTIKVPSVNTPSYVWVWLLSFDSRNPVSRALQGSSSMQYSH